MSKEDKSKALDLAILQIEKEFGKEAIMKLGESTAYDASDAIPTGALPLDVAIGIGGIPRGRVIEIYGPESSGKTTLSLSIAAQAQKKGGTVAFIDAEHALDPQYSERIGVNINDLLISQPDSGEQALEIAEKLIRSGALDLIIIDSVAALVPRAEIDGEMGDSHMGLQARLMSQALRKLTSTISRSKTSIIFINQLRQKIGVMFGNPETTTGGMALKFYASLRLDIRRIETIKSGDQMLGSRVRVKVVKNKVAPPFKQAEFDMMYGIGISHESCILDLGVKSGFIEKSGTWYMHAGTRMGQGSENAKKYLTENPQVTAELEKKIREQLLPPAHPKEAVKQPEKEPVKAGKK
ncbi:MAG: recombinase RecA [bacterium]